MIAFAVSFGSCRSANGLRTTNTLPKFELFAPARSDMPDVDVVWSHAGVLQGDFVDHPHDLVGPLEGR